MAWAWPLLRATHPEDAAQLAKAVARDEAGRLVESMSRRLAPLGAATIVNEYCSLRMAGNAEQARALLRRAAQKRVPLPVQP
jgi:hypothetical protein